jgi:hypothetical protein
MHDAIVLARNRGSSKLRATVAIAPPPGVRGLAAPRLLWFSRLLRPRFAFATKGQAGACSATANADRRLGRAARAPPEAARATASRLSGSHGTPFGRRETTASGTDPCLWPGGAAPAPRPWDLVRREARRRESAVECQQPPVVRSRNSAMADDHDLARDAAIANRGNAITAGRTDRAGYGVSRLIGCRPRRGAEASRLATYPRSVSCVACRTARLSRGLFVELAELLELGERVVGEFWRRLFLGRCRGDARDCEATSFAAATGSS